MVKRRVFSYNLLGHLPLDRGFGKLIIPKATARSWVFEILETGLIGKGEACLGRPGLDEENRDVLLSVGINRTSHTKTSTAKQGGEGK